MNKKINVLSLFDGMSCGQIALQRAGIGVDNYFASEVDKHAIKITQKNFPNTTHLGDVKDLESTKLPKIDLLIGGSPCQSFSFAGKREGMTTESNEEILDLDRYLELKSERFTFKGQSYLFWEYVRVLKETKPTHFLLENVVMNKNWEAVITKALGVEPILINSALVSAQNRKRLYWTNIPNIGQPEDRGILLADILEDSDYSEPASIRGQYINKACIIGRRLNAEGVRKDYDKSIPITQCLEVRASNTTKSNCLTTVQKDNVLTYLPVGRHVDVYGKNLPYRNYTLNELCRLQTVPENYFQDVSESQSRKMLGNGWTVDVIAYIFENIKENHE